MAKMAAFKPGAKEGHAMTKRAKIGVEKVL